MIFQNIKNKQDRKAQAEIMGLLLIVILVALGFVFYIKFAINDDGGSSKIQEFKETDLGRSFVASLSKTTIVCNGRNLELKDVLAGIAKGETRCQNQEQLVKTKISEILSETLKVMGTNYNLTIKKGVDTNNLELVEDYAFVNEDFDEEGSCHSRKPHSTSISQISLYPRPETLYIMLYICS